MSAETDTIRCMNCLDGMRAIPDGSIDLIITDPPYDFISTKGAGLCKKREYFKELNPMSAGISNEHLDEMIRILKKPNLYLFCSKDQLRQYFDYFGDIGCKIDLLTWHKTNPVPTCNNKYLSDTEYCIYVRKGVRLYGTYETKHKYWVTPVNAEDKIIYGHPTVKPLPIIEQLVINSSLPGDVILDPFIGSGTTAVAAVKNGRHYIGYDIEQQYVDTANRRVQDVVADLKIKIGTNGGGNLH